MSTIPDWRQQATDRRGRLHGFVVTPGLEEALAGELAGVALEGPRWPGLVTARAAALEGLRPLDPVFARQQLPEASLVKHASVEGLAAEAFAAVEPAIASWSGPLAVHVYTPDPAAYRTLAAHARRFEGAFVELVQARRPRGRRLAPAPGSADAAWGSGALLVQAAVVARTSVLASVASPRAVATGGFDLQPWPAGRAAVASERAPPSRAYRKLVEAWAWLGAWPRAGETCVDLGSAPGGWALTAAARGARVIAVDRAPPAAAVLRHPGVTFVRGSAFAYEPPGPVDWLLCDVICEPRRTIELVARWMERASCRAVVATLKFKGGGGYRAAGEARAALARFGWPFLRVKNLAHHHNEAAILARRG